MENLRIDLAHEPDFNIGPLSVHPSTRELSCANERQVIEPRVMQVLVALYRAGGAVVSKDDLALSCWEGRVVGEDAINRVLSRLRRVSEGIAKDVFQVETVTRVGYRLRYDIIPVPKSMITEWLESPDRSISRRTAMIGGATALAAIGASLVILDRQRSWTTEQSALLFEAEAALKYGTLEQVAAAVALLQEASRRFPRSAEIWGKLAIAYRRQGVNNSLASGGNILDRSEAAARRALEIDPENADGAVVLAVGRGLWYSTYSDYDRKTQQALARFPRDEIARGARSTFLFETGRIHESLTTGSALVAGSHFSPRATSHARKLWSVGRLDEAELVLDRLIRRWPRNDSIWRSRLTFLTYSRRFNDSVAMLNDSEKWPDNLEEDKINPIKVQVEALESNDPRKIAQALQHFDDVAAINPEMARDAASFASATGQLDAAFGYLKLLFVDGELATKIKRDFSARYFRPHSGKLTYFLFEPPMKAARADPRFDTLTAYLGLADYWRRANLKPDYLNFSYKTN